jgi:hypothetical protein
VAYGAMSRANLQAVDRVVKIVRELDRYHGFVAAERRSPDAPRLEAPESPLALEAPLTNRLEMALQRLETTESAPGNGTALENSDPKISGAGLRRSSPHRRKTPPRTRRCSWAARKRRRKGLKPLNPRPE